MKSTKVEPLLKNLHHDPRYAALLKKLNLPNWHKRREMLLSPEAILIDLQRSNLRFQRRPLGCPRNINEQLLVLGLCESGTWLKAVWDIPELYCVYGTAPAKGWLGRDLFRA